MLVKIYRKKRNKGIVRFDDFGINTELKATAYFENKEEVLKSLKNESWKENISWRRVDQDIDLQIGEFVIFDNDIYLVDNEYFLSKLPDSKLEVNRFGI